MLEFFSYIGTHIYLSLLAVSIVFLLIALLADSVFHVDDFSLACALIAFWPITFIVACIVAVCIAIETVVARIEKLHPENIKYYEARNAADALCNPECDILLENIYYYDYGTICRIIKDHNLAVNISPVPTWCISSEKKRVTLNYLPITYKLHFYNAGDMAIFQFYWAIRHDT
jgi:hypothetical protein